MTCRRRGYAKYNTCLPSDALTKALGPTEFHKHIQVLLEEEKSSHTQTKANKPTAPLTTNTKMGVS
jgi:hypothetical protein